MEDQQTIQESLTPYQKWQQENYGNILPEFHTMDMPDDGNTWAERQAEIQLIKDENL